MAGAGVGAAVAVSTGGEDRVVLRLLLHRDVGIAAGCGGQGTVAGDWPCRACELPRPCGSWQGYTGVASVA